MLESASEVKQINKKLIDFPCDFQSFISAALNVPESLDVRFTHEPIFTFVSQSSPKLRMPLVRAMTRLRNESESDPREIRDKIVSLRKMTREWAGESGHPRIIDEEGQR
jgi:hypothetical protein